MKTAIAVLGGGLVREGETWKTINLGQGGDDFALSDDRWRVDAAFEIWRELPGSLIIASGGKGQLKDIPDAPTVSEVIKRELIELGVPGAVILEENRGGNTFEQLREVAVLALKNSFSDLRILSNEWHLPRVKAMLDFAPGLKETFSTLKPSLVSAEEVLLKSSPKHWQARILEARENPEMRKRVALEKRGVEEIQRGTYKYGKF
ncbi:MAG: hypothetical protein G01um1014107_184 [Parcubacteria group bacterium Gr01-1014_107]|nr:MAG: hypothetical protein G01um1014107_184 [Parcubacteria group bacterium Gr01-1014_107]